MSLGKVGLMAIAWPKLCERRRVLPQILQQ
jgi:hypothetical protein